MIWENDNDLGFVGAIANIFSLWFFCNGTGDIVVFTKRYEDFRNLNTNSILWHILTVELEEELLHSIAHDLKRLHQFSNLWTAKSKHRQRQEWITTNQIFKAQVFPLPYHMGLANPLPWHGEVFPLPWNMLWKTGFSSEWLEQKSTCSAYSWPATACGNHCVHQSMKNGWNFSCPHCCCSALLCFSTG